MLEVILLIYLCSIISKLAESKNLSKRRWVIRTVMYWILGEFTGVFIVMATGIKVESTAMDNMGVVYMMLAGMLGGFLGYLLVRKQLEDSPSNPTDI